MRIHFVFCYNLAWWALLSPVISWAERLKRISHFAIVLEWNRGQKFVYEATFPKVRKTEFGKWIKTHEINRFFTFEVPFEKQQKVLDWLDSQDGKYYPFSQLVFILFTMINKSFEKLSYRWVLNGSKWLICTELGSRFIEQFFIGQINESHDRIGLRDMLLISAQYKQAQGIWK